MIEPTLEIVRIKQGFIIIRGIAEEPIEVIADTE